MTKLLTTRLNVILYRLTLNPDGFTFYLKYTNRVTLDALLSLVTPTLRNVSQQFVDYHLKPLVQTTQSFIKDTTHFLNKLEQLGQLPQNALLVTLDVSSLYTNIPHNEGITACRHFLDTRDRNSSTVGTETLCDLIRMILTMNSFTFNDKHYLQIHGTAMGTRMAPSYANLFFAKIETDALSRAPHQPHTWWRYIDDIFMIWTHSVDDLHAFTSYLNSIHPTIKFTSNYSFTSIPFLDVNVFLNNGNITTDLYTKQTLF